jgi:hypothetical protein
MFEAPLEQEDTAYITSADPTGQPQIDPQYFSNAVDITILAAGRHFMDQGSQSSHLRDRIAEGSGLHKMQTCRPWELDSW